MNKIEKFKKFLDSLKGHGQDTLIESVEKGFQAYYESQMEMSDRRGHYITTTYETWDEESTEIGDTDDKGWYDEEGQSMEADDFDREEGKTVIDNTVEFLQDKGATEGNEEGMNAAPRWWSTVYPEHDRDFFEKGESTYYSFHLNNYTEEEKKEIYRRMKS